MLSPNKPIQIDDTPANTLDYWLGRVTRDKGRRPTEYYAVYKGCELTMHPHRAVLVKFDGRQILLTDRDKYKGRGWYKKFLEDTEATITTILAGGGEAPKPLYGDLLRTEIERREAGERNVVEDRTEWFEWLDDDELPLLFGTWLHHAGIVSGKYEITKRAVVDFHIENDEFDRAAMAMSSANLRVTLNRLAIARGAPPAHG
jgi:hypothetical protein